MKKKKQPELDKMQGVRGKIRDRIIDFRRVPGSSLIPNPKNWRTHPPEQADALRGILAQVGYADALIARETPDGLMLIDGHLRAETTPDEHVPVLVTDLTEAEADTLLACLDPLAAMAGADAVKLSELTATLDIDSAALNEMLDKLKLEHVPEVEVTEDEVPEPPADPVTKPGDLWILGEHRLLCGDSTKAEDVARLMDGEKAFLMITDPPYGVNLDQSWRDKALGDKAMGPGNASVVANDDRADWTEAWELFEGDVAYVWHAGRFSDVVMQSLRSASFEICQQLIWNKSVMVMGRSDYHFKHEPCWYAVRKGKTHRWTGDRKKTTVIDAAPPNHIMSSSKEEKTPHPTQKPVECMSYMMQNHNGDVYDPFLGSGTTLIAAEQLGRKCYGMEISPQYCDVIIERWEKLTGNKAVLNA